MMISPLMRSPRRPASRGRSCLDTGFRGAEQRSDGRNDPRDRRDRLRRREAHLRFERGGRARRVAGSDDGPGVGQLRRLRGGRRDRSDRRGRSRSDVRPGALGRDPRTGAARPRGSIEALLHARPNTRVHGRRDPHPNLVSVPGSAHAPRSGETRESAYLRSGIVEISAAGADAVETQAQTLQRDPAAYRAFVGETARLARDVDPDVQVLSGLSTHPGTRQRSRCCSTRGHRFETWSTVLPLARPAAPRGGRNLLPRGDAPSPRLITDEFGPSDVSGYGDPGTGITCPRGRERGGKEDGMNLNSILIGSEDPKPLVDYYTKPSAIRLGARAVHLVAGGDRRLHGLRAQRGQGQERSPRADLEHRDRRRQGRLRAAEGGGRDGHPGALRAGCGRRPEAPEMSVATFADPDDNYFQLVSPCSLRPTTRYRFRYRARSR